MRLAGAENGWWLGGAGVEFGTLWYVVSVTLRATGHLAMENTCG